MVLAHGHPDLVAGGGERAAYSIFQRLKRHPGIDETLFVAAAPLCFHMATPANRYWIAGAFLLWSWYVGLNVGLLDVGGSSLEVDSGLS